MKEIRWGPFRSDLLENVFGPLPRSSGSTSRAGSIPDPTEVVHERNTNQRES